MASDYIESVLEDTQGKFQSGMSQGFKRRQTPLNPALVRLVKLIDGDPVLIEAALAWVKTKKAEVEIAKMVTLRGREYVEAMVEKLQSDETE